MYLGAFYQLQVQIMEMLEGQDIDYQISITRQEPLSTSVGVAYSVSLIPPIQRHCILAVDNGPRLYELSATTSDYTYFYFYDSVGMQLFYFYTSPYLASNSRVIALASGTYHLFIGGGSSSSIDCTFQFNILDVPILTPNDSCEFYFPSGDLSYQYALLSIEEGVHYTMNLNPDADVDARFQLSIDGSFGPLIDNFGVGQSENTTDIIFWENYFAYTDWEQGPDYDYTLSDPHIYSSLYFPSIHPISQAVLAVSSINEGSAIFEYREGSKAQTISLDAPIADHFDGVDGPFWQLYRVTGLSSMHLYKFNLVHYATSDYILNPSYRIFLSMLDSQSYLFFTRPYLSDSEKIYRDTAPNSYISLQYDTFLTNAEAFYFDLHGGDRWLYVSVPDGYNGAYNPNYPIHSGDVELTISDVAPLQCDTITPININPSTSRIAFYALQLDGRSVYQIKVSGTNLQSSGIISVYNATGHQLAYSMSYTNFAEKTSLYYLCDLQCSGQHSLLVEVRGDSPVTLTITKYTDLAAASVIQLPFFVGGLMAAAAEGILIGVVIGKLKFGKKAAG